MINKSQQSINALPLAPQQYLLVLLLGLFIIIAALFDSSLSLYLIYSYNAISEGEIWRLFTGHLLHTNIYHLLLNLSALILLWALHGKYYRIKNYALLLLTTALFTSIGLYVFSPELKLYVGLSGVLHGVFIWGAIKDIQYKDKTGYFLLLGILIKIMHEQMVGASAEVIALIEADVAIDAHLWGALGGMFFSLAYYLNCKYNPSKTRQ